MKLNEEGLSLLRAQMAKHGCMDELEHFIRLCQANDWNALEVLSTTADLGEGKQLSLRATRQNGFSFLVGIHAEIKLMAHYGVLGELT